MACSCKSDLEAYFKDWFAVNDGIVVNDLELDGYKEINGENVRVNRGYLKIYGSYVRERDGVTRYRSICKKVLFTYCPFCGSRYVEKQEALDAQSTADVSGQ